MRDLNLATDGNNASEMKGSMENTNSDSCYMRTQECAARWGWHPESVRRALRRGDLGSVVLGRRRLIPISEIQRVESEGWIAPKTREVARG